MKIRLFSLKMSAVQWMTVIRLMKFLRAPGARTGSRSGVFSKQPTRIFIGSIQRKRFFDLNADFFTFFYDDSANEFEKSTMDAIVRIVRAHG